MARILLSKERAMLTLWLPICSSEFLSPLKLSLECTLEFKREFLLEEV